jgi:ubiquinone/menaquinone biosynthesis C-methylase UbiE
MKINFRENAGNKIMEINVIECSHICFLSDMLTKVIQKVPPNYYQDSVKKNVLQRIWHRWRIRTLEKVINNRYRSVLDIGCAGGYLTNILSKLTKCSKIIGLDLSDKAVEYAQEKYGSKKISFMVSDAQNIHLPSSKFDLVSAIEILEHVENPLAVLKEIHRVLKSNGTLLLAVPISNFGFETIWYLWTKTKGRVWKDAHLHKFKNKDIVDIIESSGFSIKEIKNSHLGMIVFIKAAKND